MLSKCRVTHVLWVIWDAEFDGDIHFLKFGPRKGQLKVKLGQNRANFKIQIFLTKINLSCAVVSQDSKNVTCFYVGQLKIPEITF